MFIPLVIDFVLRQGEFAVELHERVAARTLALFGPSGAGKTTVLEAIAGLRRPSSGVIRVGERALYDAARSIDLPPRHRRVGYVPQDVALFPHMTVRRNIMYGIYGAAGSDGVGLARVIEILEIGELINRGDVASLSGGERQRIAIARALMSSPAVLLLDEPLGAVETDRRRRIAETLGRVRDELSVPLVYVTHDAAEARMVADWVITLDRGRVVASGPPGAVLP